MIRTNVVKLSVIPAFAYREKTASGDIGIVIVRPDQRQPGIGSISKKTGEAVPLKNTPVDVYPAEAFAEAVELTGGLEFRKQGKAKVSKKMLKEPKVKEEPKPVEVEPFVYEVLIEKYTDKNGKFSYELMNKDFIQFAHRSTVVKDKIAEKESAKKIVRYITHTKIRNITKNDDLTDEEVDKIIEILDEIYPKGVFKELNAEIRKALK
ncbi:MAG: hypothetical protein IKE21_10025 [Erysipelotrichaceae bacterium]|nr:hypothetical protein [Erysipelotrichaceae bacterium]